MSAYNPFPSITEYKTKEYDPPEEIELNSRGIHPLPPIWEGGRKTLARGNPYDVETADKEEDYGDDSVPIYTATSVGTSETGASKAGGLLVAVGLLAGVVILGAIAGAAEKQK